MNRKRVIVVGAGISGLTAARALAKERDVTLLEATLRTGGNIQTVSNAGFTIDGGPDAWVNSKPQATKLAKELGLESELMPTLEAARKVYISQGGELYPMPDGLALGVPTKFWPIATTPVFSWVSKLRMGLEPLIPPRADGADESIGEFFSRRLGEEITDKLIGPMLAGIYAGDPWELSLRATFPQFFDQEKKYGSLMRAVREARRAMAMSPPSTPGEPAKRPSVFTSLKGGLVTLVDALAESIRGSVTVRVGAPVREVGRVEGTGEGAGTGTRAWAVITEAGERFVAEDVVFAGPAHIAERATRESAPELSSALGRIRYASTATVFFALRNEDLGRPLDGSGFIVPRSERHAAMAGTWISSKWAHRAPEGHALVRVFFGGAGREAVLDLDDAELVDLAAHELEALMGLAPRPLFTRVFRFERANPQPTMGHLDRVAAVREELARLGGLHVTGSGFSVGIPDCVRLAQETAAGVLARG